MALEGGTRLDLGRVFAAVEAAAPVDAVDVIAREIQKQVGALDVSFLIADYSGNALVRLGRGGPAVGRRSSGDDTATTVRLSGSVYEDVVRSQRVEVLPADSGVRMLAPVTNRGDVMGVLELLLLGEADTDTVDYVAAAAHVLAFVVLANQRFTDLFEWGQRSAPVNLAAEIQRRLLPNALACEGGQFTIAGALEPAGHVGGDTFDYSLDRETLHVSLTDAMGHETDAALLACLIVGSLRNSRRKGVSLTDQACTANTALLDHGKADQYVTGQLLRIDLATGAAHIINAGHPQPLLLRDGQVERIELDADLPFGMLRDTPYRSQTLALQPGDRVVLVTDGLLERNHSGIVLPAFVATRSHLHPREFVQELTRSVATARQLRDDATALCLDWHGVNDHDRDADTGADRPGASRQQVSGWPH